MMAANSLAGMETVEDFFVNPNNFPGKLWLLVNDPRIRSVCWDASGEGILIHQRSFQAEVLLSHTRQISKYFKTRDFTSFLRQLNLYGFRKVHREHNISEGHHYMPQLHHFHNPNFKRNKPELLLNLRRLTPANRAKLVDGMEPTSFSSEHAHQAMLNSLLENLFKRDAVLVEHQTTPYLHSNAPQQGNALDEPSCSSQAFAMGHSDPCPVTLGINKAVPVPVFQDFLIDSPSAHGAMPYHPLYGFNTPVYQSLSPDLDSNVPHSQQPAASSAHHGNYPADCSVGYLHPTDQDPYWNAGGAPDSRDSDSVDLHTVLEVVKELQAADLREVAEMDIYL